MAGEEDGRGRSHRTRAEEARATALATTPRAWQVHSACAEAADNAQYLETLRGAFEQLERIKAGEARASIGSAEGQAVDERGERLQSERDGKAANVALPCDDLCGE